MSNRKEAVKAWRELILGMSEDELVDRWRADHARLQRTVQSITGIRQVHDELDAELCRCQQEGDGTALLLDHVLRPNYFGSQLSRLRRLDDDDTRSHSFHMLLEEMMLRPEITSRERYAALTRPGGHPDEDLIQIEFDGIAGEGADHIPVERLRSWSQELTSDLADVTKHVNKHIAHLDRDADDYSLTWGALSRAIDSLDTHVNATGLPVNGVTARGDVTILDDWREPFRRGLFNND